jgi:hypothetical protein
MREEGAMTIAAKIAGLIEALRLEPAPTCPRHAMRWSAGPSACRCSPGDAVFRAVSNGNVIGAERLQAASVSLVMKNLAADLAMHRGEAATRTEAKAKASKVSGHSLRSGYATSAAAARIPVLTIAQQTRHASLEVLQGYVRSVDRWDEGSGLRGIRRKRASNA